MTTMTDEWNAYKQAVYGGKLHPQQEKECRQAFFAGAGVAFALIHDFADMPHDDGLAATRQLGHEIHSEIKARAMNLGAQN